MNDEVNRIIKNVHLEARRGSVIEGKQVIDWGYIKENCLRIAEALLVQTNQDRFPISLECICNLRKIRIAQYSPVATRGIGSFDFQGEIIPDNEGFIVNLNSRHSATRKRATLAHEIGHSLFYDTSKSPPRKVYGINDPTEEWVCWDFARSLLMPKWSILEFVSLYKETPKPQLIYDIAKKFEVSVDILLKRIRRDFGSWKDSTMFVGTFINGNFTPNDIYKGQSDKGFTIRGKNSLLNTKELKTFITFLSISQENEFIKKEISINENSYSVELLRYNNSPVGILGIIKEAR